MPKVMRSWSKPDGILNLIGIKNVDLSVFMYGTHISVDFIKDFEKANGGVHIERGEKREVFLYIEDQCFHADLVNVDRNGVDIDTLQIRYDGNIELKNFFQEAFHTSYDYIMSRKQEQKDSGQIRVPEELAEYMEFYAMETPFCYQVKLVKHEQSIQDGQESAGRKITEDALIIAYYLSKFDTVAYQMLGFSSFSAAFKGIAPLIPLNQNSLKLLRDQYDSVNDNDRVGWHQKPLTVSRQKIVDAYQDWSEEQLRKLVLERIAYLKQQKFILVEERLNESDSMIEEDADFSYEASESRGKTYSFSMLQEDTGLLDEELQQWIRSIERKKQAILYGPPGTGKTYVAEKLAQYFTSESDGMIELLQFHPAYAYEDFIQGIRPCSNEDGSLSYLVVPGRFLDFCRKASKKQGKSVLIIDEINRANLARVFGELMFLLEYRDRSVPLAGGGMLTIPSNIIIIGTMNTADRSIAVVDHALRRLFAFLALRPHYEVLRKYQELAGVSVDGLIQVLEEVNRSIDNPNYEVGISFFMVEDLKAKLADIWKLEIEPYLEEYFFDQLDKVRQFSLNEIKDRL